MGEVGHGGRPGETLGGQGLAPIGSVSPSRLGYLRARCCFDISAGWTERVVAVHGSAFRVPSAPFRFGFRGQPSAPADLREVADTVCSRSGGERRPRTAYLDVRIASRSLCDFACLVFRNDYTASIALEHRPAGAGSDAPGYMLLPHHELMLDPHCEDDAQAWHAIHRGQLMQEPQPDVDSSPTAASRQAVLRIHLRQPSSNWPEFGLQSLQAYRLARPEEAVDEVASSRGAPKPTATGLLREALEKAAEARSLKAPSAASLPKHAVVNRISLG